MDLSMNIHERIALSQGQSFWKVRLASGRVLSELDTVTDIRKARMHKTEWLEDLAGSGDIANVREVALCTPRGVARIESERPYAFFQINRGYADLFASTKMKYVQIVGCLTGNNGECIAAIWDVLEQQIYPDFHTNVLDFAAWHEGIAPIGRLNIEALGLVL